MKRGTYARYALDSSNKVHVYKTIDPMGDRNSDVIKLGYSPIKAGDPATMSIYRKNRGHKLRKDILVIVHKNDNLPADCA